MAQVSEEREDRVDTPEPDPGKQPEPAASPEQPEKKASRAGRNLPAAIGVGLLLGAAIIVSLLTVRYLFIGVVAIAIAVGTFEFAGVLRRVADIKVALIPVVVGGQAMIWLAWPYGREGALTAFVLTVLACLLWRLPGGAQGYLRDISASVFAAAYLPLFGAFAAMLVTPGDGVGRRFSSASSRRTPAGTSPACWAASIRWHPASARRRPGKASPGPWLPVWSRAR